MIFVKGGTFQMGSNEQSNEKPIHSVTVSDFYLAETEVTNAQFAAFLNAKGNQEEGGQQWYDTEGAGYNGYAKSYIKKNSRDTWVVDDGKENYPVNYVSWYGAVAYCKWLGADYRLPTEAKWEYAAGNAAKHSKYSWGDGNPTKYKGGNLRDESFKKINTNYIWEGYDDGYAGLSPVAQFGANELGLYDMTGSLWEWCSDWYGSEYYASSPKLNPQGPTSGSYRVVRGGSWDDFPSGLRVADRGSWGPSYWYGGLGFRPARTL
ncbi:MAG: formylglycine-generating enzyme family protein, partial [Bacteroidota bacterium]